MLSRIYIKNYILIDELDIELSDGLNVITGETGSGKSILINAIDIAFGARGGKELIKNGADKALIEITILNKKQNIKELFEEYGIDDRGNEIILSREINQSGSRSRINGCLVNQEFMRKFRELFIDINSQHLTYSLLQPKFHIILLDSYAKKTCKELFESYKNGYYEYKTLLNDLETLKLSASQTEEQIDFLKFQVNEIEDAQIIDSEEDINLNNELEVLENVEKLKELTGISYWALSGEDASIIEGLFKVKANLGKASAMDNSLANIEEEFIGAIEGIKNVSSFLRDYSTSLNNDEERINTIQERLFILDKLKRKYGGTLENVIREGEKLRKELNNIEFSTQNIEELEKVIDAKKAELMILAEKISNERQNYAKVLASMIVEKLEDLELPKVKFEINFEKCDLSQNGVDKVEFLISTNVSEDLKPLMKVASGGELSRVMLAIKSIFAQCDEIGTVIFDEIDTGISGKASQSVADEVKALSKHMQILMITHQAIIASKSDRHIYVKKTQDKKTSVDISILEDNDKIKAIAELASGEANAESIKFAEMLVG